MMSAMETVLKVTAIDLSFFFQAEDGIRDLTVTGVQTCALPILEFLRQRIWTWREEWKAGERARLMKVRLQKGPGFSPYSIELSKQRVHGESPAEIGRASCRERV